MNSRRIVAALLLLLAASSNAQGDDLVITSDRSISFGSYGTVSVTNGAAVKVEDLLPGVADLRIDLLTCGPDTTLSVLGGQVDEVRVTERAQADIFDGTVGKIDCAADATVSIHGEDIGQLWIYGTVNFHGGTKQPGLPVGTWVEGRLNLHGGDVSDYFRIVDGEVHVYGL